MLIFIRKTFKWCPASRSPEESTWQRLKERNKKRYVK